MKVKSASPVTTAIPPPHVPKMAVPWDNTGGFGLSAVQTAESVESVRGLLQAKTRAVNQTDHRSSHFHSHVIDIPDLFCMHLTHGTIQYVGILAVHKYKVSVDQSVSGDDAVRREIPFVQVEIGYFSR